MIVNFYNSSSDKRALNKNISMVSGGIDCQLKEPCSVLNPRLIVNRSTVSQYASCNYVYIPTFKRYYFAEFTALAGDMLQVDCKVDVLMSYASQIRGISCTIERQQYKTNKYIVDKLMVIRSTKNLQRASVGTYSAGTGLYLTVDGGADNGTK